jgi:BirA family biotin operon repressor/biotin-[acetyl-CoA-carboxylase] ligase
MNIIKLDAIDSTNDFLKELSRSQSVENFTVVTAVHQTKGKGQMGSVWEAEIGKNLTMSILVKDILSSITEIYTLNIAISLAVFQALKELNIPKLSIKWPNDIMSDTKKIGGILIENGIKTDSRIESIVGIGLNVNQKDFIGLPNASSLAVVSNSEFDLDDLVAKIHFQIKKNCGLLVSDQSELLWKKFHQVLFRIGVPMPFEDDRKNRFMAIIQKVSDDGKLELLLEDDSLKTFGIKEISMLY